MRKISLKEEYVEKIQELRNVVYLDDKKTGVCFTKHIIIEIMAFHGSIGKNSIIDLVISELNNIGFNVTTEEEKEFKKYLNGIVELWVEK